MRSDYYYDSKGGGAIHAAVWTPDTTPKAIFQIVHGIAEHVDRYEAFANTLCQHGFIVVAEDHMGHGGSVGNQPLGYFSGGWFAAVADTYRLLRDTMAKHPGLPYFLFGHSMGSFMVRTLLAEYPDSGIHGAIICGTGWQPGFMLLAGNALSSLSCKINGETKIDMGLYKLIFGGYNKKVEHPETAFDWLSRDHASVQNYADDPLCGFIPTAGLLRDMMRGMAYIEKPETLSKMNMDIPMLFVAGGDDPVGNYGKGVQQCTQAFRSAGVKDLTARIFPLCRHEILNELNRDEVMDYIIQWVENKILSK